MSTTVHEPEPARERDKHGERERDTNASNNNSERARLSRGVAPVIGIAILIGVLTIAGVTVSAVALGFSGDLPSLDDASSITDPDEDNVYFPPDPAEFTVNSVTVDPDPVGQDNDFTVTSTVQNTGEKLDTQNITIEFDGTEETIENATLDGRDSVTETTTFTAPSEPGGYDVIVSTANDTREHALEVVEIEPATFSVNTVSLDPDTVEEGDSFTVTADVENTGELAGDEELVFDIHGDSQSVLVSLDGGDSTTETVTLTAPEDADEYTVTVSTSDDSSTAQLTVEEPPEPAEFNVNTVSLDPSTVFEGESFDVNTDIENLGDLADEQLVSYTIEDGDSTTETVSLTGSETQSGTVTLTAPETMGEYNVTVSTDDDSVTRTLFVEDPDVNTATPGTTDLQNAQDDMDGDGTEQDPYVITTDYQLQAMNLDLDAHYKLGDDVSAAGTTEWNDGAGFTPVGSGDEFTGSLDGAGYEITGLYINRPDELFMALFSQTDTGGVIENVDLIGVDITGERRAGGVVGDSYGTIENVAVTGVVEGTASRAGGLVAGNYGTITDSTTDVTVTGEQRVGGLTGLNSGDVTGSEAHGDVTGTEHFQVGGLVGILSGTVEGSEAHGDVTGKDEVGGLVGRDGGDVTDSVAFGDVTGTDAGTVGSFIGDPQDNSGNGEVTIIDE